MNRISQIFTHLRERYPSAGCELNFSTPFELLVAVILSAQCTDKRVNEVTKDLFKIASTPRQFADMDIVDLEKAIFTCGFYRNKAKNIISASKSICDNFGGEVPQNLQELISLAGVGRKTANVILSVAFDKDAIAVDTHVFRVSHRLDFSQGKTPDDVERDLMQVVPSEFLHDAHHLLIFHGRYCCKAQRPDCGECPISELCVEKDKIRQNKKVKNKRENLCL